MDSFEKFDETLPDIDAFYDELKEEPITQDAYNHVINVWNTFEMESLGDLHDLYVITDVLFLVDTFEKQRKLCYDTYKLESLHYYTLPGFTYDACLKMTKVKLEYIKDIDMMQMIENGIRGGELLSLISLKIFILLKFNNIIIGLWRVMSYIDPYISHLADII